MREAIRRVFGFPSVAAEAEADEERRWENETWVIEPEQVGFTARLKELWRYRRIIWFLARQAVKDRYSGMTLGVAWLFIRPLAPLFISAVIFGRFLKVPSEGMPYFLFFLSGSSIWRIFERTMRWVTRSLEQHRGLLKKVYFPRLAAPIASAAPAWVEFSIFLGLMVLSSFYYLWKDGTFYLRIGFPMLVALFSGLMTVLFAGSMCLFTTVLALRHRDFGYGIRYVTQVWMYITPVIYPLSNVPEKYQWVIALNPMTGLVETFKWGMLGIGQPPGLHLAYSVGATFVAMAAGVWFFTSSEAGSVERL
jgi:lipopolysaccharide transport system permease protein